MLVKSLSVLTVVAACLGTGSLAVAEDLASLNLQNAPTLAEMSGERVADNHGMMDEDHDMMGDDMMDHDMMDDDMMMGAGHELHQNLKAVETFYHMLSNPTDPELATMAEKVIAENWDSEPTPRGGDGLMGFVRSIQAFGQMIPDLNWEPQEILQDGNRYIVRSIATGTPTQPFMGIQPNGNSFEIMSIDIHTVEDGKIVTSYHVEEWATAMRQLSGQ